MRVELALTCGSGVMQPRLGPDSDTAGWGDFLMASLRCLELKERRDTELRL